MKINERFSVLLSLYNGEKEEYLREALSSIIGQTVLPSEIIVVKDGVLSDSLNKVCEDYADQNPLLFKFIQLKKNQGLGKALQIGLQSCTYQLVARMDTDDIAKPKRFEKQIIEFISDPELAILGSAIEEFSKSINDVHSVRQVPITHDEIRAYAKKRNPFNHMTVMFRKDAILDVGNYQSFYLNEDYYLWFRLLKNGYKAKNLSESLLYARADENMYRRRGGLKYFLQEAKLQNIFYKAKFINEFEYVRNLGMRFLARFLPNNIRVHVYKNFMRRHV